MARESLCIGWCIVRWCVVCSVVTGCDDNGEGTVIFTSDKTVRCGQPVATPLGSDEESAAGTPRALAEWIGDAHVIPVVWWAHELGDTPSASIMRTTATVVLSAAPDTAEWVTFPLEGAICEARLEMKGKMTFDTMDGAFREWFDVLFIKRASSESSMEVVATVPLDTMDNFFGMYNYEAILHKYHEPTLFLEAEASPRITSGRLTVAGRSGDAPPTIVAALNGG